MARIDPNCLLAVAIVCLLTSCTGAKSGDQSSAGGHSCCTEKAAPATKDEAQTTVAGNQPKDAATAAKPAADSAIKATLSGSPEAAPATSH